MPVHSVVNMIPKSLSGEEHQDSEPSLAVNPANPKQIVGAALTPNPEGLHKAAPIYLSTDGGRTWQLRMVVPDGGAHGTHDITVAFGKKGRLYVFSRNPHTGSMHLDLLASVADPTPQRWEYSFKPDQPWAVAAGVDPQDLVFIGFNIGKAHLVREQHAPDLQASSNTLERRSQTVCDGPPVRIAVHPKGIVYAAYLRYTGTHPKYKVDVCVARDDKWGTGQFGFNDLVDTGDSKPGKRVVSGVLTNWEATMGQERLGGDLAIAVDPTNEKTVWLAWCDLVGSDWVMHVRRSTDAGKSWSDDLRTIKNAKNPGLAVTGERRLGLVYQQWTAASQWVTSQWATTLEVTSNAWGTVEKNVLHKAWADEPAWVFQPYLGDYLSLLAVGNDLYGAFSGSNKPDKANNFPSGIIYQRQADWANRRLLNGTKTVSVSIDPFFFRWVPKAQGPVGDSVPVDRPAAT